MSTLSSVPPETRDVLNRLRFQYRAFGLLALSYPEFRECQFVAPMLDAIARRSQITGLVFQFASERFGDDALEPDHPALPNVLSWPEGLKEGGYCGDLGVRFHYCISSYMQAWRLQLLRKDDGFSLFLPTYGVMRKARSYRAGLDYLIALMTNGYVASLREFSGAVQIVVSFATRMGEELFSSWLDLPPSGPALEQLGEAADKRPVDPVRALAAVDYLTEALFSRVQAAQRESRNATDWLIGCCEAFALAHVVWDVAKAYVDERGATPERATAIAFVQELEADVGAYFHLFHGSKWLWHSPAVMSWVWHLYRKRSPDDWISAVRNDRFVIPDDLIPVLDKSDPDNESSLAWPARWTTFSADFAQSLCFLRGGHGEFVRFYQVDGRSKCDMTREAGISLRPRLMRIVGGGDAPQPPEWRRAVIAELNSLANEYPWSSSVLLELGVQKDELGQHKDAIVDFKQAVALEPTHWPNWRSLAAACKRAGQLGDAEFSIQLAQGIKEMDLPVSRRPES